MKMNLLRLAAAVALVMPHAANADAVSEFYSGKTVKVVIGGSMGGAYGLYAQLLSRHVNRHLSGAPTVVVQSMPGSGGNKAMNYTTNAGPQDGSMVSIVQISVAMETLFNPKIRFNAKDYQYLGRFADANIVATAHKRSAFKSWKDAKTKVFNYGSIGRRNVTYIGAAVLNMMAGTKLKIISGYRGTKTSYLAMERGELDAAATSWTTLNVRHAKELKDGTFIPILQLAAKRQSYLPNTPAITEFGNTKGEKTFTRIVGVTSEIGRSLAGPPSMPKARVAAWRKAFTATMNDPVFKADIAKRKSRLNPMTGVQITQVVDSIMDLSKGDIAAANAVYQKLLKAK
ncbi:tripartite tricarboxylate transporter substrate-binding protein [Alphaproteobacteria bacterium]|nr:tripartite tricarboxylate transporter substrate-binding protein [Alphaproteobacteria bacterium]